MKKRTLYKLVPALALAGWAWLVWNVLEGISGRQPATVCLVKELTGLPCPSCGTTRALILLIQGRLVESVLLNPFGVLLALGLTVFPLWIAFDLLRAKNSFHAFYTTVERVLTDRRWIAFAGAALVLLNWMWNISKGL